MSRSSQTSPPAAYVQGTPASTMSSPLPLSESEQAMVTLKVGPNEKVFVLHIDMICSVSEFFNNAFKGPFKEGREKMMVLQDTAEDVFNAVMDWMYYRKLPVPQKGEQDEFWRKNDQGFRIERQWDYLMSSCYIFSTIYNVPALAEAILDLFREQYSEIQPIYPTMVTIIRVFDNVAETSPLCQLFIEKFAQYWDPSQCKAYDHLTKDLPQSFVLQALKKVAERRSSLQKEMENQNLCWGTQGSFLDHRFNGPVDTEHGPKNRMREYKRRMASRIENAVVNMQRPRHSRYHRYEPPRLSRARLQQAHNYYY
ncbi:hypothetical protein IWZ03DRAFT_431571 [Phyllosticta citriasiana]|uniref:BTB domain-containing protein n=1 Tax=Phyllosticta citriasiana TaxID=595635 RepID=A0ABR1KC81_9PEZI